VKGTLNGFISKFDRFAYGALEENIDTKIQVGPGQYDPKAIEGHPKAA
jgi:hypothetical protein